MKQIIFSIISLICIEQSLTAQDSLSKNNGTFNIKVININRQVTKGYLYTITDSSVFLSKNKNALRFYRIDSSNKQIFSFSDIEKIHLEPKGGIVRGAIIGAAICGLVVGMFNDLPPLISFGPDDDFHGSFSKFTRGALSGVLIGAVIGSLIALSGQKDFFIHGKKEKFAKMRNKILKTIN